ncbi:MAG: tricarballylate utilization 4Fe-4S protein TcuB [Pseudomonadales bacterium]|jgi:citrate/tricarballylate utilization protein|nr:tricarballylate utilization 4Fe-4S protein TcuB [Pseudomonadales bacterium]MDP7360226.1 tricarballylate utilization 4Fe-4S protein TcuB [Pseudomonadales bacterium]MDP7596730.1 tricarballylate utilization 4Fe-4S protein TcuB [Pseudomonadales bacterium]HJN50282.1 tricarballylate utilization 4Fe-4S protein TcuB [Pseudomonadales bacterium]|tara:strand:- start:1138 stop:2256 length:1119 start_codon:yes stop_codon:yes gene_type:complete
MPKDEALTEARRIMRICNACRYCEGFCAVYPAMELQQNFADQDLTYLANLCHNCRGCYYACQYAPPHEFAVNVPQTFAKLRIESYARFAWPRFLAGLFDRNGWAVTLISAVCVVVVLLLTILLQEPAVLLSSHHGEGSFYAVVPYLTMVVPAALVSVYVVVALSISSVRFWHAINVHVSQPLGERNRVGLRSLAVATWDSLSLTYLGGGGYGCYYPQDSVSHARRWFHHLVFYGFICCFIATTIAAIYAHLLQRSAPYPFLSWPVLLGTGGGVALLVGTGGLLGLKWRSDRAPDHAGARGMDVGFLVLLFLTSLTGLLLLVLRETAAMGMLLAVHLGVVLALFTTLPHGKFVHGIYRYAALIRYSVEQSRDP